MISDETFERRFRYRLNKHDMKLHKEKNYYGIPVYYITSYEFPARPEDDDNYRWMTFDEVERYVAKLAEQDAEYQAEQRLKRREDKH